MCTLFDRNFFSYTTNGQVAARREKNALSLALPLPLSLALASAFFGFGLCGFAFGFALAVAAGGVIVSVRHSLSGTTNRVRQYHQKHYLELFQKLHNLQILASTKSYLKTSMSRDHYSFWPNVAMTLLPIEYMRTNLRWVTLH